MYSLLIIEDERWEREGLVSLIDCARFGIGRIYTAADAVEGLRLLRAVRPELVITDIRMPGMSGLEMLERAGDALKGSACLILSGYGEFAYAQKALRIGAIDFLVKPVNEAELLAALDRAVRALPCAPTQSPDLAQLIDSGFSPSEIASALGLRTLLGLRAAALAQASPEAALPPLRFRRDEVVYCLMRPQDQLPEEGWAAAGVSRVERDEDLLSAFLRARQAMENARFHWVREPLVYAPAASEPLCAEPTRRAERMALEQALAALDEERVHRAMDGVRRRLAAGARLHREQALNELTQLTQGLGLALEAKLACAQTLDGMLEALQARLDERIAAVRRGLSEPERYVVRRVILMVDENYRCSDFNLQMLAGQIFLSPNYIGTLFKRSTGVTFNDYLCRHRLMAAQRLLTEQGLRVSAAAEQVGIPNVSYFCAQFRSAYGLTPSNYRKRV